MTEQLKCYATYFQSRECSGTFDKDAVALSDAASSNFRTNRNLKGKSIQKKQSSDCQTGIIPFAARKKADKCVDSAVDNQS